MDMQVFGTDEILLLVALFALSLFGFIQAVTVLITASETAVRRMWWSVAGATGIFAVLVFVYGGAM